MNMEIIILIYLSVVSVLICVFISKNINQRKEINHRIEALEKDENIYFRRRYR